MSIFFVAIPGSKDKQHLQKCLEAGLHLADQNNLQAISIPCVGTGGFGLTAADSAQVTFQALKSFRETSKNLRKVRVVVFQIKMTEEFLKTKAMQEVQDMPQWESDSTSGDTMSEKTRVEKRTKDSTAKSSSTTELSVKIYVTGKDKESVLTAVDALKKGFVEACTTEKVENEAVSKLSQKQIDFLIRKAKERDVKLEIEVNKNYIMVLGEQTEVKAMVSEIWHEVDERNKEIEEEKQEIMLSQNVEWSYRKNLLSKKIPLSPKENGKLEMAYFKQQPKVLLPLGGQEFEIDLQGKTGHGQQNSEKIKLFREIKRAEEGQCMHTVKS